MSRRRRNLTLHLLKALLILLVTADFSFIWYRFYEEAIYRKFYFYGNFVVIFVAMLLFVIFARLYGVFQLRISRAVDLIYSNAIALLMTGFLMYCIIILLARRLPNALPLLLFWLIGFIVGVVWAHVAIRVTQFVVPLQKVLILYDNEEARVNGQYIIEKIPWRYTLIGQEHVSEDVHDTVEKIKRYRPNQVMLCGIHSSPRNSILKYCVENHITVMIRPNIGDFLVNSAKDVQLANLPVMLCEETPQSNLYMIGKRIFDVILGILGLIVFSPFMILTAIAIKLYDGGPIIYKQVRLTQNRKQFYVYKFRSMKVDAEKDGVARLASKNDDRITPVGKFIRAVRIDEMPQIFCILSGDMSIVGPRPERPEIVEQYEKEMPEFALRLRTKAGLTGYAQVYGKYNTEPYDKLQMDLMYIAQQSFVTDLKIIFATIKILFLPESTEGVSAGQTTAMDGDKAE